MDNINSSYSSSTLWHSTSAAWLDLPDEIWLNILSRLPIQDLGRVSQVCRRIYTLAQDQSLKLHVVANMMKGIYLQTCFSKPDSNITCYEEIFRTKDHFIANAKNCILVWNLIDKKLMVTIRSSKCIGITKEDNLIVSSEFETKTFKVFSILENEFLEESSICKEALKIEENGTYSIDTKTNKIIGVFPGGIIKIRDLMTNSEKTLKGKAEYNNIPPILTEEGKLLLASGKCIHIWDLAKESLETEFKGEGEIISLTAAKGRIASVSENSKYIEIWDLALMQWVDFLPGHQRPFNCLFSQDGNILFSGSWRKIKVWDMKHFSQYSRPLYTMMKKIVKDKIVIYKRDYNRMLLEGDGKLITSSRHSEDPCIWDFNASNQQVWEQIAEKFEGDIHDNKAFCKKKERVLRMPFEERKNVYPNISRVDYVFKPTREEEFNARVNAFNNLHPKKISKLIREYLKQLP